MKLYIIRHGVAEEPGRGFPDDFARPLTPEGREKTRQAARGLAALECEPEAIATSPLVRAEETARILAEVLAPGIEPVVLSCLSPGGDVREAIEWLAESQSGSAMVVGHMPDVALLAVRCLCGSGQFDLAFKKAAVCCLRFEGPPVPGEALLEWHMPPSALRRLAG